MRRLISSLAVVIAMAAHAAHAQTSGFSWYANAQTKAFLGYCKPGLTNTRGRVYANCDLVWNTFREGYSHGLDAANRACFLTDAQLENFIAYIEEQGEEYINGTAWLFAMRDFIGKRWKTCREARDNPTR